MFIYLIPQTESSKGSPTISSNLVMTSRVKPIEEISTEKEEEIKETEVKNDSHEGHAHNDMLSPYSNLPARKNPLSKSPSKSPKRQESVTEKRKKDITEYLVKGEIQYPDLLSDEISKVDETLLKECKKAGQVGGKF